MTLAACVMAATSALLAQSQVQAGEYMYNVPAGATSDAFPKVIRLCIAPSPKDPKSCDTWTLAGDHYTSQHPQNPPAILVVQKLTKENVVFRLVNPAIAGMAGTIDGMVGRFSAENNSTTSGVSMTPGGTVGSFEASWGAALHNPAIAHDDPARVPQPTYAAAKFDPSAPVPIPQVMHFCAAHCLTFTLEKDGNLHNYTNLPDQFNEHRVLAIKTFTFEKVLILRTDTGSHPGGGPMNGQMQYGNSNAISNEGWALSWGEALNLLPGSDDERAMRERGSSGQQPQMTSIGEDNMAALGMFFRVFGSLGSSSPEPEKKSLIGCAPGTFNRNCGR